MQAAPRCDCSPCTELSSAAPAQQCHADDSSILLLPHPLLIREDTETSITWRRKSKKAIARGAQHIFCLGLSTNFSLCINDASLPIQFAPPELLLHPDGKNS